MTTQHQNSPLDSPIFLAGVDMLERTGLVQFRIGHTDEEEEGAPVIWHATGSWNIGTDGKPMPKGGRRKYEAAAAMNPVDAVMRLCELVIDGGACIHCGRPAIFISGIDGGPLDAIGCVTAYDPELSTFRRGCEGDFK